MESFDCALAVRLAAFAELTADERRTVNELVSRTARWLAPREEIMSQGERPRAVHVIVDGWAVSTKQLIDGRRQIVNFLVPGDLCATNIYILDRADHALAALTHARVASIGAADFEAMMVASPRIARALWWNELSAASVQREWTTSLGQRNAYERIAHLLCELYMRLHAVGLTQRGGCEFPITQNDLADATGLTSVHVNRTIQQLRHDGLIELHDKRLIPNDIKRLAEAGLFHADYLHLAPSIHGG